MLQGYVGRGKTYLAASIANALVERDVDVRFIVVPDFLDELRATFDTSSMGSESELMNLIKTAPVLILDDLGAHNYTDFVSIKTLFCHFELSYQLRASHRRNNKFVSGIHGRTVGNAHHFPVGGGLPLFQMNETNNILYGETSIENR